MSFANFFFRRRRRREERNRRASLPGLLSHLAARGFQPGTVIDVGAAQGAFTKDCLRVFPDPAYVLIEPLEENRGFLSQLEALTPRLRFIIAAACDKPGEVTLHVHSHLDSSSIYCEFEGPSVDGAPRTVPAVTVDGLLSQRSDCPPPFLFKADVQGAELDVLRGAETALASAAIVLLEVSLFGFFKDGPQLHDVVTFMKAHGFVAYDVYSPQYRLYDDALGQVDIAFVQEDGPFRQYHGYATPQQRAAQADAFRKRWDRQSHRLRGSGPMS